MADLRIQDRLQPSLLDRLIDDEPGQRSEGVERRALSRAQLRAAVLRDLGWLFNATRAEPGAESERADERAQWARCPQARRSVLNYGLPALAGGTVSSVDIGTMRAAVLEALRNYEPRIAADTLQVEVRTDAGQQRNTVQITIKGRLWSQPVPLELLLAADVDVETGSTRVRDLRN